MEDLKKKTGLNRKGNTTKIALIGGIIVLVVLIGGTFWTAYNASKDTNEAVRTVSLLYLDELAGRREQVVEDNLRDRIRDLDAAIELMDENDLSDEEHLQAYQARMKKLYNLEKFAFVDSNGVIYTSKGTQENIGEYDIDYSDITEPQISVYNLNSEDKKAVIAVPVDKYLDGEHLVVCFMEIDMDEMLSGVSMTSNDAGTTFCNIYTRDGVALSNTVLGGLAEEDNLLDAMKNAQFEDGYSYEEFVREFSSGEKGHVSFTYNDVEETLAYEPVKGTDWQLTYLIRESVISDNLSFVSRGIIIRSLLQSLLTALILITMFAFIIAQNRRNEKLAIERETAEAESRVKQEEMEQRIALQEQLLEDEKQRTEQSRMITALSSDYWAVYYIELDSDEGVCYQQHADVEGGFKAGERFRYMESVTAYAERYITDKYRDEFMAIAQPDAIREGLRERRVISYTYMVSRHGHETYEQVRFAGVRHPEDRDDHIVHSVGACFVDVDDEMRASMSQKQALSDALAAAEEANKAKTVFLSNMSHEIRTPMNAIIGLDNIAMNDPETPERTKEYLEKIDASADHLLKLINNILDMSRIESGRLSLKNEEFSFARLLEAVNIMFSGQCQNAGLDYRCHVTGHVDDYYIGDDMKLRQVLINILGNAVKFTPEGGSVSMDVERTAHFSGKSTLTFTIKDTGIGMSEEFLPHIFDTFAQEDATITSRYGSSGLGLAIAKNIVEMMNGSIRVESVKGEGTTFIVSVTLGDSGRRDDGSAAAAGDVHPGDLSVLVIDDDEVACEHARLVLEKAGISSETASTGDEGVEMVRLRHARREPYDLIIVDWKMEEMDGVETTRRIREIAGDESAIVILTAYRWDDVLDEAMEAGVDSFLSKPIFAASVLDEYRSARSRRQLISRSEPARAELRGRRILVAEDVPVNAEIIKVILESRGLLPDMTTNGIEVTEAFASHEPGYYSAVLMDVRMPEMDGLEATRVIRAMDRPDAKAIPVIALTANAFDEDVQRSMQAGMDAHITKPMQPEVLFDTLEKLIKD